MSEYGYVNPSDTVDISLVDFPPPEAARAPLALVDNGRLLYIPRTPPVPEPLRTTTMGAEPQAGWGIYRLVRATNPAPGPRSYYTPAVNYAFRNAGDTGPGVVGDGTSIVQETRTYTEIPIGDLFKRKRQEIRAQDQTVRYNAVDTALNANWWLVVTQDMRFELDGIQGNWAQRQIDGKVWPVGTNNPWVGVYNTATTDARRVQVPGADATAKADTWNTLYTEKTQHDQATGNATTASLDALDVAYDDGNGDWQAVADHDAANPIWGYPPTVTIDPEASVFFGA